jgi:lipid-binding SYLF domain-containing protein
MKKFVTLVALFSLGAATVAFAETREEVQNRLDNAALVLHQIMGAPDRGIPEEVLDHAQCVAVVPHRKRMECAGVLCYYRRQLGIADRSRRRGSGYDLPG